MDRLLRRSSPSVALSVEHRSVSLWCWSTWLSLACDGLRSISRKVKLIENLGVIRDVDWWTESPDILLLNNDLFYASALMQRLRSFLSAIGVMNLFAEVAWRDAARRFLTGQESRAAWTVSRFTEFRLLPSLINVSVIFSQSIVFFAFPFFVCLFTAFQSYYLTVSLDVPAGVGCPVASQVWGGQR